MRVAFVHPDLGIGGAERLIVDAALALQNRGHQVVVYTSHYSPKHCFEETKELDVNVKGDFLPRHFFGYFHLLFATLRAFYLATWIFLWHPHNYDVIIVDQISFSIPILRKCASKLLFYCHFPDQYLAPKAEKSIKGLIRIVYRWIFDTLEGTTIGMAGRVLVNSQFTASKFREAFPSIGVRPEVLYPAINTACYDREWSAESPEIKKISSDKTTLLSLNRFERKKNVQLALEAFLWLKHDLPEETFAKMRIVIAGGYDSRVRENIEHLEELRNFCVKHNLTHFTCFAGESGTIQPSNAQILFLPSISEQQRNYLIHTARCLLYTPSFEHFGIVPIEAMYCGLPVIAVNNGGPRETVLHNMTGMLCESQSRAFGAAAKTIITASESDYNKMAIAAKKHVKGTFTMSQFGTKLEGTLVSLLKKT